MAKQAKSLVTRVCSKAFDLLASLELAVFVILAMAAGSAVGTFVESLYDRKVASIVVYDSWWFNSILVLFVLNLLFAALSRWPWKRNHIGFLITHAGLIIVVIGSAMTRYSGVDGTVALAEGESARAVQLDENYLNVFLAEPGQNYSRLLSERMEFSPLDETFTDQREWQLEAELPGKDVSQPVATLKLLDWWPYATRKVGIRFDRERKKGVPAVRFRIVGSRANMEEWLFLNGIQGSTIDLGPARVRFQKGKPRLDAPATKRTLYIYFLEDSDDLPLLAQVAKGERELQEMGRAAYTKRVTLGWMDFEFMLEEFYHRAVPTTDYRRSTKEDPMAVQVIHIDLNGERRWIEQGASAQILNSNRLFYVQYTKRRVDLGFEISLNDFRIKFYEGSNQPMSYESRVRVPGVGDNIVIKMNEPLDHKGFTFYQSSYSSDAEGNPVISVLSVNRDPGRWVKYVGCILLVSGILLMFYFRPVYSGKSKWLKKKPAAGGPGGTV